VAFSLFSKKVDKLIGLDISTTAIKIVELSKSGSNYKLDSYVVEHLPQGLMVDQAIADKEKVGELLESAFKKGKFSCRQVAVAVSGIAATSKIVQVGADLSNKEIEEQISGIAADHIPYPIEEVALDFEIIGPSDLLDEDGGKQRDVLISACRSEVIDDYLEVLGYADLEAKVVEVGIHSIERAGGLIDDIALGKNIALFDIGAINTSLHVFNKGTIIYSRDQGFGGNNLDELIASKYGLSVEDAEINKRIGKLPNSYESEVLSGFREQIAQQLARSLQFFFATGQFDYIDGVLLTGGTSLLSRIVPYLEGELEIDVAIANLFDKTEFKRQIDKNRLSYDVSLLMVPCGLAMRSFN